MRQTDFSKLARPIHPMPEFVRDELIECGLMDAYLSRPPYQQNDYVEWISRAERSETKPKRLVQMLAELEQGDVYRKINYRR